MAHKAIAYRWETETPKGVSENITFALGALSIKWQCVRNKTDKLDKWYVEERNIAEDFKKAFGYIPEKFAISIAANSQHTGSLAEAEIDWIEFVPDSKTN